MIDFDTFQVQISKRISTIERQIRELFLRLNSAFIPPSGWIASTSTWTYSSVDGVTGVINTSADETGNIQVGDRIRYDQTTTQYAIVTVISATQITAYHGTDYALINATITNPSYSHVKNPLGFPADPEKWTVTLSDTTNAFDTAPPASTWENLGIDGGTLGLKLDIPIGKWRVYYKVVGQLDFTVAAATTIAMRVTLSTANNTQSDASFTTTQGMTAPISTGIGRWEFPLSDKLLSLAAKTTHYLNGFTGGGMTTMSFRGDLATTLVRCECAYL